MLMRRLDHDPGYGTWTKVRSMTRTALKNLCLTRFSRLTKTFDAGNTGVTNPFLPASRRRPCLEPQYQLRD